MCVCVCSVCACVHSRPSCYRRRPARRLTRRTPSLSIHCNKRRPYCQFTAAACVWSYRYCYYYCFVVVLTFDNKQHRYHCRNICASSASLPYSYTFVRHIIFVAPFFFFRSKNCRRSQRYACNWHGRGGRWQVKRKKKSRLENPCDVSSTGYIHAFAV